MITRVAKGMHIQGASPDWGCISSIGNVLRIDDVVSVDWGEGYLIAEASREKLPTLEIDDTFPEKCLYRIDFKDWDLLVVELQKKKD